MMLFAEASDTAAWASIVGNVVQSGFAALVAWYLLTKALPQILETFAKERREERELNLQIEERRNTDSKEKLANLVAEHKVVVALVAKESREKIVNVVSEHKEAMSVVVKHCETESARRDEAYLREISNMTESQRNNTEVMEQVRDVLRKIEFRATLSDDTPPTRRHNAGPATA